MRLVVFAPVVACGAIHAACVTTSFDRAPDRFDAASSNDAAPASSDAHLGAEADDSDSDATAIYPAIGTASVPQVVTMSGPVLKAPKIVPVFFAGDDPSSVATLTDFVKKVGQTDYWKAAVTEYGSGPAVGLDAVVLTTADLPPPMLDDSTIQAWLAQKLNAGDPAFPVGDSDTLYALFYPAGVTITLTTGVGGGPDAGSADGGIPDASAEGGVASEASDGGEVFEAGPAQAPLDGGVGEAGGPVAPPVVSCEAFAGYHQNIVLDDAHANRSVAYAVIPRCLHPMEPGLDSVTAAASHEFIEAATDPFPLTSPAYVQVDFGHIYWMAALGGGEVGDMCQALPGSFTKLAELPDYMVQRTWSNKAAREGQDPCVPPLSSDVYFNSAPLFRDSVPFSIAGEVVRVTGAHVPVGSSETVALDLFSTGPTGSPWTVSAQDLASLSGQPQELEFSFDTPTGLNGGRIQMTITTLAAGRRNQELFLLESSRAGEQHLWVGVVGN